VKVLVLGGCGFIGSHLVDALLSRGHEVVVLDRHAERHREPLRKVSYFLGNFSDKMLLLEAMTGVDAVCHLVSTTFPGTANLDPSADVSGNLIGTLSLMDTMRSVGVRRLIYLSSGGTVYGHPKSEPIPESHALNPINSYGIVKAAVENYLWMYQAEYGFLPVAVRAANPFGPRQGHTGVQGVISTLLRKTLNGQDIEIWGDGTVVRDYLHVGDVADLCVRALGSDFVGPVNAGSGQGRSLNEVLASVRRVTGREVQPVYKPARRVDVARSVLDVTLAGEKLGWQARRDFDEALSETWSWMKNQEQSWPRQT
jgi:UDP-glucose 4-epimerase